MKKTIFLAAGVVALSLMSFASSNNLGIIQFDGDVISMKDTDKVTPEELSFLSVNVLGWTYCDKQSETNQCNTRNRNFPYSASLEVQKRMNLLIAKYQ
ncbi:hypothetical protein SAMN05421841_3798 [Chryseobacterium wanjuense]|jgi:hypothetical protein|uniref:Uncharacterized protein n=1 Tax=Chryseobacterium wanjuense TaxID=356305 RepID=A0A1I0S3L5_9FLAO|nr:hypothetical protein [Chryseobacterium wanjuense]SEW48335.1 hypothetical protein SAMN05421841_3798 [Chryseobacterium wanjuense]